MLENGTIICATDEQLISQTSPLLRANVFFCSILALITFFLSFKSLFILKHRTIFHPSTKLLLFFGLVFVNLHEIAHMAIQIPALYRSFVLSDAPCKIMRGSKECSLNNEVLIYSVSGIILTQSAMSIERLIATIFPQKYSKMKFLPGIILSIIVVFGGLLPPIIIGWDEHDEPVPNCFFFPKAAALRANLTLFILTIIIVISVLINFMVMYFNKKSELSSRFYVEQRYQKREALISTEIVCYIAIAQLFGMVFYTSSVLAIRLHREYIPTYLYYNIVWWAYAVPLAAVSLPALFIYRVHQVGKCRKRVITLITTKTETTDEHMKSLKEMWS